MVPLQDRLMTDDQWIDNPAINQINAMYQHAEQEIAIPGTIVCGVASVFDKLCGFSCHGSKTPSPHGADAVDNSCELAFQSKKDGEGS